MIRYEQITPRQAVELILQGKSDEIYVETIEGLREVNQKEILVTHIGNVNWFIRISDIENGS